MLSLDSIIALNIIAKSKDNWLLLNKAPVLSDSERDELLCRTVINVDRLLCAVSRVLPKTGKSAFFKVGHN